MQRARTGLRPSESQVQLESDIKLTLSLQPALVPPTMGRLVYEMMASIISVPKTATSPPNILERDLEEYAALSAQAYGITSKVTVLAHGARQSSIGAATALRRARILIGATREKTVVEGEEINSALSLGANAIEYFNIVQNATYRPQAACEECKEVSTAFCRHKASPQTHLVPMRVKGPGVEGSAWVLHQQNRRKRQLVKTFTPQVKKGTFGVAEVPLGFKAYCNPQTKLTVDPHVGERAGEHGIVGISQAEFAKLVLPPPDEDRGMDISGNAFGDSFRGSVDWNGYTLVVLGTGHGLDGEIELDELLAVTITDGCQVLGPRHPAADTLTLVSKGVFSDCPEDLRNALTVSHSWTGVPPLLPVFEIRDGAAVLTQIAADVREVDNDASRTSGFEIVERDPRPGSLTQRIFSIVIHHLHEQIKVTALKYAVNAPTMVEFLKLIRAYFVGNLMLSKKWYSRIVESGPGVDQIHWMGVFVRMAVSHWYFIGSRAKFSPTYEQPRLAPIAQLSESQVGYVFMPPMLSFQKGVIGITLRPMQPWLFGLFAGKETGDKATGANDGPTLRNVAAGLNPRRAASIAVDFPLFVDAGYLGDAKGQTDDSVTFIAGVLARAVTEEHRRRGGLLADASSMMVGRTYHHSFLVVVMEKKTHVFVSQAVRRSSTIGGRSKPLWYYQPQIPTVRRIRETYANPTTILTFAKLVSLAGLTYW